MKLSMQIRFSQLFVGYIRILALLSIYCLRSGNSQKDNNSEKRLPSWTESYVPGDHLDYFGDLGTDISDPSNIDNPLNEQFSTSTRQQDGYVIPKRDWSPSAKRGWEVIKKRGPVTATKRGWEVFDKRNTNAGSAWEPKLMHSLQYDQIGKQSTNKRGWEVFKKRDQIANEDGNARNWEKRGWEAIDFFYPDSPAKSKVTHPKRQSISKQKYDTDTQPRDKNAYRLLEDLKILIIKIFIRKILDDLRGADRTEDSSLLPLGIGKKSENHRNDNAVNKQTFSKRGWEAVDVCASCSQRRRSWSSINNDRETFKKTVCRCCDSYKLNTCCDLCELL